MRRPEQDGADRAAARALGWTSLALGTLELAAPATVQRLLGLDGNGRYSSLVRTLGVRELMHGVDLLSHDDPAPGVRARVAGDVLDGAVLMAAAPRTQHPVRFAVVSALVLGVVAADLALAGRLGAQAAA